MLICIWPAQVQARLQSCFEANHRLHILAGRDDLVRVGIDVDGNSITSIVVLSSYVADDSLARVYLSCRLAAVEAETKQKQLA